MFCLAINFFTGEAVTSKQNDSDSEKNKIIGFKDILAGCDIVLMVLIVYGVFFTTDLVIFSKIDFNESSMKNIS